VSAGCRRKPGQTGLVLLTLSAVALTGTACGGKAAHRAISHTGPLVARTRPPTTATSVLAGPADAVAAQLARTLFASSPVVIVALAGSRYALAVAAVDARRAHAPVLLTSPRSAKRTKPVSPLTQADITSLHPLAVLAVGIPAGPLSAALRGIHVVTNPAKLHATKAPRPLRSTALLVHQGDASAQASAAIATALAAGARVIFVPGFDPRADPVTIATVAAARPREVLALGAKFGPASLLAARVAVAATGVQLPGGGEVLFPMRRLVALYGHPGAPSLGALGQQELAESITRAKRLARLYRPLSGVPVIPAFEIIASVAQGASEPEGGSYSYLTPLAEIKPWVDAATRAGIYVILDLQAGRASLLAQAEYYQSLLELPDVGLAIDPEWKLRPDQLPLRQIGTVTSKQVNSVASWLAALAARRHLPQKLLVLHQFELSMLGDEHGIDTRHDDLAIVIHMDGQGTPGNKQQTWDAVTGAAPSHVHFGWKNFFTKDHPMLSPAQTMVKTPQPFMISYQ
jgi:hypothetical protein